MDDWQVYQAVSKLVSQIFPRIRASIHVAADVDRPDLIAVAKLRAGASGGRRWRVLLDAAWLGRDVEPGAASKDMLYVFGGSSHPVP